MYGTYCSRCHGSTGSGNFLKGIPANRSTSLNRNQIAELVTRGLEEFPKMPRFSKMSRSSALKIADFVLQFEVRELGSRQVWTISPEGPQFDPFATE